MKKQQIEMLIRSLGIGATYRGYRYLNHAIYLCLEDEEYLLSINKLLYPLIAKEFHTTVSSVERDIRTVIQVCWDRGNREYLQSLAFHPLTTRPTAGEFLDILIGYLQHNSDTNPSI